MLAVDLTEFTNSSGWHVTHADGTNLFEIVSNNGVRKAGKFTDRKFAEAALYEYLSDVQKHNMKISSKAEKVAKEEKMQAKKEKVSPINIEAVENTEAPMLPLKRKNPTDWWKKNSRTD